MSREDTRCLISWEISGGDGLQGLIISALTALDIQAIYGDWMGRAYPVSWQKTPVVYGRKAIMISTCIPDGNRRIAVAQQVYIEGSLVTWLTVILVHD
jgi:DUF917 family protein